MQGKFCGDRHAFPHAVVDGVKVPKDDEQQAIQHMRTIKCSGAGLRDIQTWLAATQGRTLSHIGVRDILGDASR